MPKTYVIAGSRRWVFVGAEDSNLLQPLDREHSPQDASIEDGLAWSILADHLRGNVEGEDIATSACSDFACQFFAGTMEGFDIQIITDEQIDLWLAMWRMFRTDSTS